MPHDASFNKTAANSAGIDMKDGFRQESKSPSLSIFACLAFYAGVMLAGG